MIQIGIKSDPIQYRYSFDWLFDLMAETGTRYLQLGSFFELYSLDDDYFHELRTKAEDRGIRIKSVFTAHRELGGFFSGNLHLEKVARKNYEKLIHVASVVGADYCGSNPGAVYRDKMDSKQKGILCYLDHMSELCALAREKNLRALTIEPMSSMAEPPTTPEEIDLILGKMMSLYQENPQKLVPVYLCGDVSHGLADIEQRVVHTNLDLFVHGIPKMAEFHFKNTDAAYGQTFGFSTDEQRRGIIDLSQILKICTDHEGKWPVDDIVGYLEIGGPKLGRDYSDPLLGGQLRTSLKALHDTWETVKL